MKSIQLPEGIKPLCLIVPLLLSACHTAPHRPWLNDVATAGHMPADYIDPTKSLFPLGSYPQSVDKWFPPGPGKVAGFGGAVAKTNDLGFETYFNIYFRLAVQYHGYGLGRLLGQEGLNAASKAGVTALAITRINNQPSIKLIEKLGMQPYLCRLMDFGPPQQVYRIESTRR